MSATYEFADFQVDPGEGKLTSRGYTVLLQDQPFRLLTLLLSRAGTIVTREEIQAHLWPGNTYVEFDKSLRVAVSKLREALRDSPNEPVYIETLPRRGYRFIAPVKVVELAAVAPASSAVEATPLIALPDPGPVSIPAARPQVNPPPSIRTQPQIRYRIAIGVALATLLVALPIYLVRGRLNRVIAPTVEARPVARRSVAVIGLRNLTGSPDDRWISTALAEMLSDELAASDRLRVVSGEEVTHAGLADPLSATPSHESLTRFGKQLGADTILFGSYAVTRGPGGAAPQLRLDLRLESVATDAPPLALVETGSATDLFALVSSGGTELRHHFGLEDLPEEAAASVRGSLPENSPAAQLYAQGLERFRVFDLSAARDLLEKAVELEPDRAATHLALSNTWHAMGYEAKALTEAQTAAKLDAGLPRQEVLTMQAAVAQLSADWAKAAEIDRSLITFYPDNIDYGLQLAQVQGSQSDPAGALATLKGMKRKGLPEVDEARIDLAEGTFDLHVDDFHGAIDAADRACQIGRELDRKQFCARGLWIKASGLERLAKYPESLAISAQSQALYREIGDQQGQGLALLMAGDVLYDQSKTADARADFVAAVDIFKALGNRRNFAITVERVGNCYFDEGALAESRKYYQQALDAYDDIHWDGGIASGIGNVANVEEVEGDIEGALASNNRGLALFEKSSDKRGVGSTLSNMGNLEMERGDLDKASQDFDRAAQIQAQIAYARGLAHARIGQGEVLLERDQVPAAIEHDQLTLKGTQGIDEPAVIATAKAWLGLATLEAGHAAEATDLLQQSAAAALDEKDHAFATQALAWLARSQIQQGHVSEALTTANRSVAESHSQFGPQAPIVANLALGRALLAQKNAAGAREQFRASAEAAGKHGYGLLEMEARILLAESVTSAPERKRQLDGLASQADQHGWKLLAATARKASH
ncbi:MAG TPA: winged helix-turn-helix domain-containing protein [Terracidiphilus sp.]|jgi:DNA-binding winged helix-turn-helix (wHTH) protein/tetratricopeptide (TPR) repeat protein